MLEASYHPDLVQDVVFMELQKREDTEIYNEYHRLANEIYEADEVIRSRDFKKLDARFFQTLGLHKPLNDVLKDLKCLSEGLQVIHVSKARTKDEIGSDLARNKQEVFLKIFPEDFAEPASFKKMLRHELMHVADMLDERFEYGDEKLALSAIQENAVRERYKVLWDTFIDSRLERLEKNDPARKEERFQAFKALFNSVTKSSERDTFEGLWAETALTHGRLKELANKPFLVTTYAGAGSMQSESPLVGGPCPICKCPTHEWVKGPEIRPEAIERAKADSTGWEPEQGMCTTCHEYYLEKAGLLWI